MRQSAGLLLYRRRDGPLEVMLAHMGGPFWARRDAGAWSIPKGEYGPDEDPLSAARREFVEELGLPVPSTEAIELGEIKQSTGKLVRTFAIEADIDVSNITSNTFGLEWPKGSGQTREFPEIDRADWFDLATAADKLVKGQVGFLGLLERHLAQT